MMPIREIEGAGPLLAETVPGTRVAVFVDTGLYWRELWLIAPGWVSGGKQLHNPASNRTGLFWVAWRLMHLWLQTNH